MHAQHIGILTKISRILGENNVSKIKICTNLNKSSEYIDWMQQNYGYNFKKFKLVLKLDVKYFLGNSQIWLRREGVNICLFFVHVWLGDVTKLNYKRKTTNSVLAPFISSNLIVWGIISSDENHYKCLKIHRHPTLNY